MRLDSPAIDFGLLDQQVSIERLLYAVVEESRLSSWCSGPGLGGWGQLQTGRPQAGEELWQVYGRVLKPIGWGRHLRKASVTTGST